MLVRTGIATNVGGDTRLFPKYGAGPAPRPGYTGARIKYVPADIGAPNYGFNAAGPAGLVDPNIIGGKEIQYLASFGENFFNLRLGVAPGQEQLATSDHVIMNTPGVNLWKAERMDWSGVNLRYQGPSTDLALKLSLLVGQSIVCDIYWIE